MLDTLRRIWARPRVRVLVLLPVSGGLFYLALRQVGWGYLLDSLREANYWLVGLALAVGLVSHIARAARWRELLLAAGLDASLYEVFYAVMFGYACNLLLPRAGEVARCARLAELKRFPLSETLGSVVSERLSDVVVFLLMTLMAVVVSFHYFGAFLWERIVAPFMARFQGSSLWLGLTLLVGAAALLTGLVWAIKRGIFGARLRQWCGRVARGLGRGMGTIIHLPRRGRFLLYTVLIWVCYWLMTYLVCRAYPATAALPVSTSYLLLVVGTFGMMVPVQGGFGAFHLAIALWLEVEGIPRPEGLAYATLSHGAQTLLLVVIAVALMVREGMRGKRRTPPTLNDTAYCAATPPRQS